MENIKDYLIENNLTVIKTDSREIVVSYKFDLVELDAANHYVKELEDASDLEKEEEFNQYLEDIASDNISDIIEDISEELDIALSFKPSKIIDNEQLFVINKNHNF